MVLLEVTRLGKQYHLRPSLVGRLLGGRRERHIQAVDDVTFTLAEGECLGIAGESGSGKSTTCTLIAGLERPSTGTILFRNEDIAGYDAAAWRRFRSQMQIIFQDPFESLNPRMRVVDQVAEGPRALRLWPEAEIQARVLRMLEDVGLPPATYRDRFPHQMSGGERQRVGIASALVMEPKLVIADEPLSMLDVSIRAGILDLLRDLAKRYQFSVLYVSHDLSIMQGFVDRLMVMYLGQVVEYGRFADVISNPRHPYTAALLAAVPVPDPEARRPVPNLNDEIARPSDHAPGCRFATRCHEVVELCRHDRPALSAAAQAPQLVRCHLRHTAPLLTATRGAAVPNRGQTRAEVPSHDS